MKNCRIKKYLKIGVKLKIIWKKTRVLKIIWKLKYWKLNLKIEIFKMGVLKIKFENLNFEKLFENWSFETNFWKQEWRIKEMRTCGLWEWFIEGGILKLT